MFSDPTFWVAASTVIFLALAFKHIKAALFSMLDSRSLRIKKELEEAESLKTEARNVLESYRKKYQEAVKESEEIIETARHEAAMLLEAAQREMDSLIKKRMELVLQRITQAEAAAVNDIRSNAVDIAVGATRMIVKEKMQQGTAEELVTAAMSDMQRKLH